MEPAEEEILRLHAEGNWEEILSRFSRNKFLPWVWPEKGDLDFVADAARRRNSDSVVSIGCGSGLLEWLLQMATGIRVVGVETDGTWWASRYSAGTFLPITLVEDSRAGRLDMDTSTSVLLFCYFNNLPAFLNYVNNFRGDCFVVIGPGPGRGTYTIPEPFALPEGLEGFWQLSDQREIRSSGDFIAIYVKSFLK